jgi:hypothetical protein
MALPDISANEYYRQALAKSKSADADTKASGEAELDDIYKQRYQQEYGGMGAAALGDFKTLLGRLEGSKIRQQQAKDISARPNIYATGLANMMSQF